MKTQKSPIRILAYLIRFLEYLRNIITWELKDLTGYTSIPGIGKKIYWMIANYAIRVVFCPYIPELYFTSDSYRQNILELKKLLKHELVKYVFVFLLIYQTRTRFKIYIFFYFYFNLKNSVSEFT